MRVPETKYKVCFNSAGIDGPGFSVSVLREAESWSPNSYSDLEWRGDHYEGDVPMDPGDEFCILVRGMGERRARGIFELRQEAGLTAQGERFIFNDHGLLLTTDDPHFPRVFDGPSRYNRVPDHP